MNVQKWGHLKPAHVEQILFIHLYEDAVDATTFLLLAHSSVILALIVNPMLESWVPGHLKSCTYIHTPKKKKKIVHLVVSKKPLKVLRIIT